MNKGFKIHVKPFDLFQNQSKYQKLRMKEKLFKYGYLTFILLLAIATYVTNKTIFLK